MGSVPLSRAAICWLALSLGAWASAQHRVWIVDVQGRPGTDFTDLQVAVDRVPLGDILDVRDGAYGPAYGLIVRRGVTIQFRAGAGLIWSTRTRRSQCRAAPFTVSISPRHRTAWDRCGRSRCGGAT